MTQEEVVKLMKSSKSAKEWNDNCSTVKKACGGYPSFWYAAILGAGVVAEAQLTHGWS